MEESPLLDTKERHGYESTSSKVIDVTGLAATGSNVDEESKLKTNKRKRWASVYIMYFTMFLGAVTFSIVISSIYPFLQKITDDHASTTFLGYVVAAYSLGQLIASPLFGFWSDYQHTMVPILFSLVISVVANLLYAYADAFPENLAQYILIVSRALIGVGAGNAAVCRSYVSAATTENERTGAFAGISGSQAIGFIVGPVLGLMFVPLGSSGVVWEPIKLYINMYTGPAYISAFLAFVNIVLVVMLFREYRLVHRKDLSSWRMKRIDKDLMVNSTINSSTDINSSTHQVNVVKSYDRVNAVVCIFLFFITFFVFSVYETIITPYSMDEFAWTKKKAVLYNNILFGILAILAIVTFVLVKFVTKVLDERTVLMIGFILMAIGFFVMIPMGNGLPKVGVSVIEPSLNVHNNITSSNLTSLFPLNNSTIPVGCRYPKLHWCVTIPQMYFFQYVLGMVFLSVGYPAALVLCYSMFSKVLGPTPQGIMMGILTASGSFARTVGPLFVTFLYDHLGPQITFAVTDAVIALAIISISISCYRLVPYNHPKGWGKKP